MKKIKYYIIGVLFLPLVVFSQQKIDIGIFESSSVGEVELRLKPNFNITNNFLTNVQFTLRWDSVANVGISPVAIPPYMIVPQGPAVYHNGYVYQIFASSPNASLNWNSGQEYKVLSFTYSDCVEFEIIKDSYTQVSNGDYYIELLGVDHTGIFYKPISDLKPYVYIGKDTSICVYNQLELDAFNPGSTYLWSTGEITQKIIVDGPSLGVGTYNYGVTVTAQNGCSAADWKIVTVDVCTGMNELNNDNIDVFPNPTYGEIFIDRAYKYEKFDVNVFDAFGSEVWRYTIIRNNMDRQVLDISGLSPGIYLLTLHGGDLSYSQKVILLN